MINDEIATIYRQSFSKILAALIRKFGAHRIDDIENAAQEAFTKAIEKWPEEGLPTDQVGWLIVVAKNNLINLYKKAQTAQAHEEHLKTENDETLHDLNEVGYKNEIEDNQLRMLFVCCHPKIPESSSIPLTLRYSCGLKTAEVARAFLTTQSAMEKKLVRAKAALRDVAPTFEIPSSKELLPRSMSVCRVLYLLFNEGYIAHDGEAVLRNDICAEAIRLGELLLTTPGLPQAEIHALLALMYFQFARSPSRVDEMGCLIPLSEQNRSLWHLPSIQSGFAHLKQSAFGEFANIYHLEALIASCHVLANRFADTNWTKIYELYSRLETLNPTPIVKVNRGIALCFAEGPESGLTFLRDLEDTPAIKGRSEFHAAKADCFAKLGKPKQATQSWQEAIKTSYSVPERKYLQKQLDVLKGG